MSLKYIFLQEEAMEVTHAFITLVLYCTIGFLSYYLWFLRGKLDRLLQKVDNEKLATLKTKESSKKASLYSSEPTKGLKYEGKLLFLLSSVFVHKSRDIFLSLR